MKKPVVLGTAVLAAAASLLYAFVIRGGGAFAATTDKNNNTVLDRERKDTTADAVNSSISLDTALFNEQITHITNGDSSGRWPVK